MKIAHGVFTWDGQERRSDRYGAIHLANRPYDGTGGITKVHHEIEQLSKLRGKRVHVTCVVLESRKSGHVGDLSHQIFPTQPEVGETIDLGVGYLFLEEGYDGTPDICLHPEDGRKVFWMDPHKLYRLHDQTVDIFIEKTSEECSPRPMLTTVDTSAVDVGDGSYQVKHAKEGDRILPSVTRLGDGAFLLESSPGRGERLEVQKVPHSEEELENMFWRLGIERSGRY